MENNELTIVSNDLVIEELESDLMIDDSTGKIFESNESLETLGIIEAEILGGDGEIESLDEVE